MFIRDLLRPTLHWCQSIVSCCVVTVMFAGVRCQAGVPSVYEDWNCHGEHLCGQSAGRVSCWQDSGRYGTCCEFQTIRLLFYKMYNGLCRHRWFVPSCLWRRWLLRCVCVSDGGRRRIAASDLSQVQRAHSGLVQLQATVLCIGHQVPRSLLGYGTRTTGESCLRNTQVILNYIYFVPYSLNYANELEE